MARKAPEPEQAPELPEAEAETFPTHDDEW